MKIIFRGGEADNRRIELFTGAETLAGLGRVGNLVAHYSATDTVRFRAPYSDRITFNLRSTGEGSFVAVVEEVARLANEARNAAAVRKVRALFRRVVERATGQAEEGALTVGDEEIPPGDIDVLAEAATPALERAHRWIDQDRKTITVESGVAQRIILNVETKEYLESEEIEENRDVQDVSVAAVNVNSRYGRVYFENLGRTVPFFVPRDATGRTLVMLSRHLVRYAERRRRGANYPTNVRIEFRRVRHLDGRLKRVIVYDCYPLEDAA
jgi:hypothetical protein